MSNPQHLVVTIMRRLRGAWPRLAAVALLSRVLAIVLFAPLLSLVTWLLLATAGQDVVADTDLARLALEPLAWFAFVLLGAGSLTIVALEQACLLTIVFAASNGVAVGVREAIGHAGALAWPMLALAVRVVARCLLAAMPFLAAAGVVLSLTLGEFDINYYLSERPPAFLVAAVSVGLLGLALAFAVAIILVRAAFAACLVLFEGASPRAALAASAARIRGAWRDVVAWLGAWALACLAASAASAWAVVVVGRALVPLAADSLPMLLVTLGGVLGLFGLSQLAVSLGQSIALGVVLTHLYESHARTTAGAAALERLGRHEPIPIPARWLGRGTLAALVAATLVSGHLLLNLELEDHAEITAHRGASGAAPENTLAAVRRAIDDGADWVEIDVQRTADDQVVVIHDADLQRVGAVALRVREATLSELAEVDVGGWFGPEFRGQRVPRLEDVLRLCASRAGVNIELKYHGPDRRLAERVIEIVEGEGMAGQVVVMSLDRGAVRQVKSLRPGWTVGLLTAAALGDLTRVEADFLAVNAGIATRGFVRRAHERGKPVHAWTVNDALGMTVLMSRGVDNLITDEPARAREVLAQRAALSPAERLLVAVGLLIGVRPASAGAQGS